MKYKVTASSDLVLEGKDGSEKPMKAGEAVEFGGKDWRLYADHIRRSDACHVEVMTEEKKEEPKKAEAPKAAAQPAKPEPAKAEAPKADAKPEKK